jgi:hypothetical protein
MSLVDVSFDSMCRRGKVLSPWRPAELADPSREKSNPKGSVCVRG